MTADELIKHFNVTFGMFWDEWPKTFEVDAETYGYCCQKVFNRDDNVIAKGDIQQVIRVYVGKNKGLFFKGVELILENKNVN